jgi:hypothetical protein
VSADRSIVIGVATLRMRQQIKWIGFASGHGDQLWPRPSPPLPGVGDVPVGIRVLATTVATVGFSFFPIALTFAILRHHLWNIDLVLNRTLVYGALTLIVIAIYVGVVGGLSAIFHAQGNTLIAFVGAGLMAVLFHRCAPLAARRQLAHVRPAR